MQALSLPTSTKRAAIGCPEPFELIEAAGAQVAVRRWGDGPPVLCLHAIGHGGGDFAEFAKRAGHAFEIIALDWPGQGNSPNDGALPRAGRYADIALAAVDRLGLRRPIIIGNSIGGAAAIRIAHRAPESVRGLVLCSPGGLIAVDATATFVIKRMEAFFNAGTRGAPWFPAAFRSYYRLLVLPGAPAREQRERIIAAGRELAPLLAEAWRGFREPDADLRNVMADIQVPVWFAWARSDRVVSWSASKHAAKRVSDHCVTLLKAGHAPFLEDPENFAAGFVDFAGDLER